MARQKWHWTKDERGWIKTRDDGARWQRGIEKICELCGAEFGWVPGSHGTGQYCSNKCSNQADKGGRHKKGAEHANWKGGRTIDSNGYVLVYTANGPYSGRYALEHRLVMEQHLGRELSSEETIHHLNGDKTDNRLENLQLFNSRHTKGVALCCADCGSTNLVPI